MVVHPGALTRWYWRGSCWSAWICLFAWMSEVGTSDYIQVPSMIMTFFFLINNERKKERKIEWKKENLDDLLVLCSKDFLREIIPVRILIFALYLCRPWVYSVPWQQVSVHEVVMVFQASIRHNVWIMGVGLWISGFCRHCQDQWHKFSTVSNSLVNLRFTSSKSLLAWQCRSSCCFVCLLW